MSIVICIKHPNSPIKLTKSTSAKDYTVYTISELGLAIICSSLMPNKVYIHNNHSSVFSMTLHSSVVIQGMTV